MPRIRLLARASWGERQRPRSVVLEEGGLGGGAASGVKCPRPQRRSSGCGCKACSSACSARLDQSSHHSCRKCLPSVDRSVSRPALMRG
eukprot:13426633-Alexandrium_andersonii.AAC.1